MVQFHAMPTVRICHGPGLGAHADTGPAAAPGVSPSPEEQKPGTELILHVLEQNNVKRMINISYRDGTLASLPKHLLCVGGDQHTVTGKEGDTSM